MRLPRSLIAPLVALSPATGGAAPLPQAPACPVFPQSNVWNRDVSRLPAQPGGDALIRRVGADAGLHADFGSFAGYGIPITVVGRGQPRRRIAFDYAGESDPGPYPIPDRPRIEGGGDRHVLLVDRDACRLYELFSVRRAGSGWRAGSGAIWDLRRNRLRPAGWTSADAAGLPILPGLVRYDEVAAGRIDHALRFTVPETRRRYVYPARHVASDSDDPGLPPMGMRVRLRASFDVSRLGPQARVIARGLKRYGMILADNGTEWFVSGASHPRFDDDDLRTLRLIRGSDLEVVDTRRLRNGR